MLKLKELLQSLCKERKEFQSQTQSLVSHDVKINTIEKQMQRWRLTLKGDHLTVKDIMEAETAIIQFSQKQTSCEEVKSLQKGEKVKRSSPILKLDPLLQDGILRVGGRLHHSALPEHKASSYHS